MTYDSVNLLKYRDKFEVCSAIHFSKYLFLKDLFCKMLKMGSGHRSNLTMNVPLHNAVRSSKYVRAEDEHERFNELQNLGIIGLLWSYYGCCAHHIRIGSVAPAWL